MITHLLRGAADFIDAVNQARAELRTGFSEREAGDYLDAAGLADAMVPDEFVDEAVLPADSDAVTAACRAVMEWVDRPENDAALIGCTPSMVAGVAVNAYRAALLSVGHADLAAHITGIQVSCLRRGMAVDATYDEIASDLLSDYSITKK
ncbi:hypothetical protein A5784_30835 [Mycobacterium sp. 852013-50091_SCH5140682]|uniref:hypothetical protein n=1 Tax=Mycobacterium sp. 852013-50091_SCH5140682 TaxID=1834109 RepID=UPI0007EB8AC4|nr:hypothetical protein [Mycobacterium sp. 852013-50091_SCH5140682]OBC14097.1 hypothetical protein A5784_30835 [Mycobacterium sp. 852013-50091_SCH5140682]